MDDKGHEPQTSTRDAKRSLALTLVPGFGRGLRRLPPRTVLGVPFDRLREARLEVGVLRSPTQLGAQLGRIDRVPTVMARTILHPIERILRLPHHPQNHAKHGDVIPLTIRADQIRLADTTLRQNRPHAAGMVLGMDPVTHVQPLAVQLRTLTIQDVRDLTRDELLHMLIRDYAAAGFVCGEDFRFGYRGEEVFKDCASLSGGELARLRFAELALERPNLMFLDEPTNHLDIYMRESLTQALAAYTGTLLLVTHDRYLMQTLGCPIMYLEDGKATFYPNFAALQNREAGKTQEQQKTEDTAKKQAYGKEQRKRRAEVRARLKKVETEIEELGAHIVELENEINDPEVLRDHLLLRDKCDELDDTRFHQQELYDEWEKLAEEQETFENEGE